MDVHVYTATSCWLLWSLTDMIIFAQRVLVMWKIKHHIVKKTQCNEINNRVNMRLLGGIKNIKQMSFQVCHQFVRWSVFILDPAVQGPLPLCLFSSHRTEQPVFSLCLHYVCLQ